MIAAAVGLALLAAAAAEPTFDTPPDWLVRPSSDEVARHFPVTASRLELRGYVLASCTVMVDGKPARCAVAEEEPTGLGFGPAALRVTEAMRFKPATLAGKPVESPVRIPIRFSMPAAPPERATTTPSQQGLVLASAIFERIGPGLFAQAMEDIASQIAADPALAPERRRLAADAWREATKALAPQAGSALAKSHAAWFREDQLLEAVRFLQGGGKGVPPSLAPAVTMKATREGLDPLAHAVSAKARQRFCAAFDCVVRSFAAPPSTPGASP